MKYVHFYFHIIDLSRIGWRIVVVGVLLHIIFQWCTYSMST